LQYNAPGHRATTSTPASGRWSSSCAIRTACKMFYSKFTRLQSMSPPSTAQSIQITSHSSFSQRLQTDVRWFRKCSSNEHYFSFIALSTTVYRNPALFADAIKDMSTVPGGCDDSVLTAIESTFTSGSFARAPVFIFTDAVANDYRQRFAVMNQLSFWRGEVQNEHHQ
jgi:hypothetical protein